MPCFYKAEVTIVFFIFTGSYLISNIGKQGYWKPR